VATDEAQSHSIQQPGTNQTECAFVAHNGGKKENWKEAILDRLLLYRLYATQLADVT
jgi:hypothetical protein